MLIVSPPDGCPFRVIRCVSIQPLRRSLSVVGPIGDKRGCGWFVREVPKADSCTAQKGRGKSGARDPQTITASQ
jgi:hypothetical protein